MTAAKKWFDFFVGGGNRQRTNVHGRRTVAPGLPWCVFRRMCDSATL